MANITDSLISTVSGTDPQNLLEYITRQRIYDSRFWKEECFGLTVADVLEKASILECIGNLPTKFLSLVLKLLQLHPETELVLESFIDQDEFKYVRALGCMYIRLTARPVDIYETLEVYYSDFRKLRVWIAPEWSVLHMDEFIHQLLTQTHVLQTALPRLPSRKTLEESNYLTPLRLSVLKDVVKDYGGPLQYLKHKALIQRHPTAISAWESRQASFKKTDEKIAVGDSRKHGSNGDTSNGETDVIDLTSKKEFGKKERRYGSLFKASYSKSVERVD